MFEAPEYHNHSGEPITGVPDVLVQAALSHTKTTTLTEAILALLNTEIKKCANERCQKEFLGIQRHRKDSKFCSRICARRSAQRAYYKRKRQNIIIIQENK